MTSIARHPCGWETLDPGSENASTRKGHRLLVEILIILAIIVLALFIWRNMVGRRV